MSVTPEQIAAILRTPPGTRARTLSEYRAALETYRAALPTEVAFGFILRLGTDDAPDKLYAERVAFCERAGIPVPDLVGEPWE